MIGALLAGGRKSARSETNDLLWEPPISCVWRVFPVECAGGANNDSSSSCVKTQSIPSVFGTFFFFFGVLVLLLRIVAGVLAGVP